MVVEALQMLIWIWDSSERNALTISREIMEWIHHPRNSEARSEGGGLISISVSERSSKTRIEPYQDVISKSRG